MLDVGKEGYPSCVCICNNVCTYIYTTQIYTIYTYTYTYTYIYIYIGIDIDIDISTIYI